MINNCINKYKKRICHLRSLVFGQYHMIFAYFTKSLEIANGLLQLSTHEKFHDGLQPA